MKRHTYRLSFFSPVKTAWIQNDRFLVHRDDGRVLVDEPIDAITKFHVLDNMVMQDNSGERFSTKIFGVRIGRFRWVSIASFKWQGPGFGYKIPNRGTDESASYRELAKQLMRSVAARRPEVRVVRGSVGVSIIWFTMSAIAIAVAIGVLFVPTIKTVPFEDLLVLWGLTLPFCAIFVWLGKSVGSAYWPTSSTVGERTHSSNSSAT